MIVPIHPDLALRNVISVQLQGVSEGYVAITYNRRRERCVTVWNWEYGFEVMVSVKYV